MFHKNLKCLCFKGHHKESEEIDKGLVSRICKELLQLNNRNNPIIKWEKDLNRYSSKGILKVNTYMHTYIQLVVILMV